MFEVSEKAGEVIKGFLAGREGPQSVRITLNEGGCGGPSLGMALDEPAKSDETFTEKGITFLVDKNLFDQVKPISIDFIETDMGAGFSVQSSLKNKGGACGNGCCGSC